MCRVQIKQHGDRQKSCTNCYGTFCIAHDKFDSGVGPPPCTRQRISSGKGILEAPLHPERNSLISLLISTKKGLLSLITLRVRRVTKWNKSGGGVEYLS